MVLDRQSRKQNLTVLARLACLSVIIVCAVATGGRKLQASSQNAPQNGTEKASPGSALSGSPSSSNFDGPAELPRIYVKSGLADTPAPGKTWKVSSADELHSALDRAHCGDTIALQAGAEFA